MANILYKQDDGKFEDKYLRKLERNQRNWKEKDKIKVEKDEPISFSRSRNLEEGVISEIQSLNTNFFI